MRETHPVVLDVVLEGDRGGLLHSEVEALRQQNIDERGSVPGVPTRCLEKRLRLLPGSLIRPRSRRSAEKRKRENEVRVSFTPCARARERERERGREGEEGTYRKVGLRLRERRHELLGRHDNQPHTKPWRTSALADLPSRPSRRQLRFEGRGQGGRILGTLILRLLDTQSLNLGEREVHRKSRRHTQYFLSTFLKGGFPT